MRFLIIIVFFTINSCRFQQVQYKAYLPMPETLYFINDSICVYTKSIDDIDSHKLFVDTFEYYKIFGKKKIIMFPINHKNILEPLKIANMQFIYDIYPNVYNISKDSIVKYSYIHPLLHDPKFHSVKSINSFSEEYAIEKLEEPFVLINSDFGLVWVRQHSILCFFDITNPNIPKRKKNIFKDKRSLYDWVTNSYEYRNYSINKNKNDSINKDSLYNNEYIYKNDLKNLIETLKFISDSICIYSVKQIKTHETSILINDTCYYSLINNNIKLISKNIHETNCNQETIICNRYMNSDILAYKNDIIFYSKIDKQSEQPIMTVKTFIKEDKCWLNMKDSLKAILDSYYDVFVPINY